MKTTTTVIALILLAPAPRPVPPAWEDAWPIPRERELLLLVDGERWSIAFGTYGQSYREGPNGKWWQGEWFIVGESVEVREFCFWTHEIVRSWSLQIVDDPKKRILAKGVIGGRKAELMQPRQRRR